MKVYIPQPDTTAAEVARKHAAFCPAADAYEIQRFCRAMSGGSPGQYTGKPVLSCFAFASESVGRPVGTVHFPLDAYARDDAEARARIGGYNGSSTLVSPLCVERYARVLSMVQRRPLARGPRIHAWMSLKMKSRGELINGFYFSQELFGRIDTAL